MFNTKIILLGLVVFVCSCSAEHEETPINLYFKNESSLPRDQVEKTVTEFLRLCPAIAKYSEDFSALKFSDGNPVHRIDKLHGWTKKFEITFKVADRPVHKELVDAMAMGHVCYYDLGGGQRPGFQPAKSPCAKICNVPERTFVDAPSMVRLDDPLSDEYKSRHASMIKIFQENVKRYKDDALRGGYQAQRNLAYTYANDSFSPDDQITACSWRAVILTSQPKANIGDQSNLRIDCSSLNDEQKSIASERAKSIFQRITSK